MDVFYLILLYIAVILTSYCIGSLNWGYIISKYIYHIDIFKVGSGNAGGTNVGRACGKKAAYAVILLDVLKTVAAVWGCFFIVQATQIKDFILIDINPDYPISTLYYLAGLGVALGHTYPFLTHFRGGKCVACYGGFCLCTNWVLAVLGVIAFLGIYFWKKRVSLSSVLAVILVLLISLTFGILNIYFDTSWAFYFNSSFKMDPSLIHTAFIFVFTAAVIYLHKANIKRLKRHEEPETHFVHKGEKPVADYEEKE